MSHPSHAVFISCAPNLMALARAVQRHLNARGRRAEIEEPRRGEGPDWLRRVARRRAQAHALLILLSKETPWAWQLAAQAEAARAKALRPELRVAPVLFDGYEAVALQAICPALQPFHLPPTSRSLDEALEALSAWLEAAPPPPLPPTALIPKRLSPYPFEEAHRFFGRDAEIVEGLKRLHGEGAPRWLSVEGPAGVGKRSFIQAGLLPTILRGGLPLAPRAWAWARLAACRDPLAGLAVALARGLGDDARAEELGALLREEGGLLDIITEHLPADQGLVLIIEGLDALPRLALDPEAPQRLDAMLAAALSGFDQRLLLLTDGAARGLPRLEGLIKEGRGARLELGAPTLDGLRAIIEGTGYGRAWPKALIDRLLSDAAHALPPEGGARALGPLSWALDALAAQPNARLDQYLAQGRGALAGALDARFNALAIDERARARALLLALIHSGRGAPDEPITLTMEEAVRCAGEGPRAAQLIEALSEPSEAAPPLLRLYHGPPQLVGLHHPALLVWWPRLRSWLEMDRPALERRRDAEALAARLPPGGALDLAGLHFCQGADLLDEHRAHLQGLLSAPTRRLIEEAQAAEAARAHAAMEREALKAEATRQRHQEALRRAARRA
ncbi:hypothetical protein KJ940_03975, partial [Myxococcota bacterium]|nr:hypothetical protein [Myxococcota bacterium]